MQNRACDVTPDGDQDKYSIALQQLDGKWWGLDVPFSSIFPSTVNANTPLQRVGINSFHAGRGVDRFTPEQYAFYDGLNGWSTTPGKYHASPLFRYAKGLRNSDFNMPDANGVVWKRLTGDQRYLNVSFTAGATYTGKKVVLMLRRRVPAGATGAPGTCTVRVRANSGGNPSTVADTQTVTSTDITDTVSKYQYFTITWSLSSTTVYHITVNGASGDRDDACWEVGCDPTVAGKKSSNDSSWTATTFSPYYRVTDADITQTFEQFIFDGANYLVSINDDQATASKLYINGLRGRAVGTQSSTTLKDTGHGSYGATNLTTDRYVNAYIRIIRGTGRGQVRRITANDADTFTVTPAWDVTPVASGSEYIVFATDWFVEITTTGLGVVTSKPMIQNGIVYFPQGDSTNMRIMRMDYTATQDHAFDVENSNNNKAYFVASGYDAATGPAAFRANVSAATGTPNSAAISVSRAPTSPLVSGLPTPVAFGTDLGFGVSILCGDNTNRITGLLFHEGLYVGKEDSLWIVQNDKASQIRIGANAAQSIYNFNAMIVASDRQLYASYQKDVYLITPQGAYPTGMKTNLPSGRSGYVASLTVAEGWIFAGVDAGAGGDSAVMMYALDTKSWRELIRSPFTGRRIRSVQWQDCPETRPRLWTEVSGELIVQEFPINGVRPYDDTGMKYQHETTLTLPTIDLFNTDAKYFARLTITTQGLATTADAESGHEIVVEWQADNDVGSENWQHGGYIRQSPSGYVDINQGDKRMMRVRVRLISSEATDPVIIETIGLSLFSRNELSEQWTVYFNLDGSDDEQNSLKLVTWLREQAKKPEPLIMFSKFVLFHNIQVTIADKPRYKVEEVDTDENDIEASIGITLTEVT